MKGKIRIVLTVLLILFVSAGTVFAGGQGEPKDDGKLKVAILLPGVITDQGWNTMAYNALKAVEKNLSAEIAYTENTPASDYEEIFRGYANAGFDVVMGHGYEFGDAAKLVAKEFQDKHFIVTSTMISQEPNLASFVINDVEAGFVEGYIAAMLTKTGKIGTIGGMEIPPIANQQKGFLAGARYYNPDVKVSAVYTGSFHDIAKGKDMAKAMLEAGVDILTPNADETSLGVVEAAREVGVTIVAGGGADLGEKNGDIVLLSLMQDYGRVFTLLVKSTLDGTFKAEPLVMGLVEGVTSLSPIRGNITLTSDQKAKIDTLIKDLVSGKVDPMDYVK